MSPSIISKNDLHLQRLDQFLRGEGDGGVFQYMTYLGRATFLGVELCAGPRFLGRNLSKLQTFGVKFGAEL